ncbi:hypothetical protein [Lelliottia wanjuensis]|uniref:hypothetical protein n=1 Tax=Lelliottia wanjuensis TaxID=3050585 RepID=UPI00254A036C|nr:hypothetical protein [Lelliottia sp. V106_16]MDK9356745.1 hypothetical protein [Lelliottia sp. V106_16]
MAAGVPQEKAVEQLQMYAEMLRSGISILELDYRRGMRELEGIRTVNAISALGILHAVAGHEERAIAHFEDALLGIDDIVLAHNFMFVLKLTNNNELILDYAYDLADRFGGKQLTNLAYSTAYRFGDIEKTIKYIDQHNRLLSEEEGRAMAEKHKLELISELEDAYRTSGCSSEQFELLARVVGRVLKSYSAETGLFEVSRNGNSSYVVDILNKSPVEIAEMNFYLAEEICAEPDLDDCRLTARFSVERELHTGVSYVNHGC